MRLSWKIGQLAGIGIYVHATFLFVFLIMGKFNEGLARAVESIVLVFLVFGCVVLHELGHALMARKFGIETLDITLYPIGGVARLRRLPRAPGAELLIALAGPAVNFAIAAPLIFLGYFAPNTLGLTSGRVTFLGELLAINVVLGLFNLIPAFPMDGGRVLRALLSIWFGRAPATRVAAGIGQVLAVIFGLTALFYLHEGIYVLLAAFIYFAAGAEAAQVAYEEHVRQYEPGGHSAGAAPPGYQWVDRGNGLWQLAPRGVRMPGSTQGAHHPWR
jgi:Zn-dependent protease